MKNKKFLLTIAMIMSLVMAVSCGDDANKTTDPNKPTNPDGPVGPTVTEKTAKDFFNALNEVVIGEDSTSGKVGKYTIKNVAKIDRVSGKAQNSSSSDIEITSSVNLSGNKVIVDDFKAAVQKAMDGLSTTGFIIKATTYSSGIESANGSGNTAETVTFTLSPAKNIKFNKDLTEQLKDNTFSIKFKPNTTDDKWAKY